MKGWALSLKVRLPAHMWAMSVLQAPSPREYRPRSAFSWASSSLNRKLPRFCHSALPFRSFHLFLSLSVGGFPNCRLHLKVQGSHGFDFHLFAAAQPLRARPVLGAGTSP